MRQPLRVVFDSRARLPLGSRLLASLDVSPVFVVVAADADPARTAALREAGAEVLAPGGSTSADRIRSALAELGRRGVTSLFLEGGRTLAAAFRAAGAIDEARTFVAPVLLGAGGAVAADAERAGAGDAGERRDALSREVTAVGEDALITARFEEW